MATLFLGGGVFDGRGTLEDGLGVLVEAAAIARVAPAAEFDGFDGETVDTTGRTLMPGLIDCHVHLCMAGAADPWVPLAKATPGEIVVTALTLARDNLAGGITAVRDCGGKDYLEFAVRDACNAGTFQGPTIRAAGRMICMTGGHGNRIGRIADGPDQVVQAVREQIHAGCDFVKIMATGGVMTPGVNPEDAHYSAAEMAAGVGEAKRFHRRTASHAQGTEGILNAVRAGINSIEHGFFMSDDCVAEMVAAGVYLVPTIAALKNIVANKRNGIPAYVVEKAERVAEAHRASIRRYYEGGGQIAMGTDAGTPFNLHGRNAAELGHMVEYGIAARDALVAATGNAADLLDLADEGEIAAGKRADLLVVEGNPLDDIQAAADPARHVAVYKRGALVDARRPTNVGRT